MDALLGFPEPWRCRRRQNCWSILAESDGTCGKCDLWDTPAEVFDGTEAVRKALSAILRTGEWFGTGHLVDVLLGNETDRIRQRGHDELPTYGIGREFDKRQWQAVFRQMMGHDLIRPDPERHGALRMTDSALPVLRGEQGVELRRDSIRAAARRPAVKTLVSEENTPLMSALKAKRRALAEAAKVPAYVVFNDRTLAEMAEDRPADLDAMARINGVGAKKLATYGDAFLEVINGAVEDMHPSRRKIAGRQGAGLYDLLLDAQSRLIRGPEGIDKPMTCSASLWPSTDS